jgi:hypothetical protein
LTAKSVKLLAALAAALLLAGPAKARPSPLLQLPMMTTGTMTFVSESVTRDDPMGAAGESTLSETFDIAVLEVLPTGSRIVFTLRSSSATGAYAAGHPFAEAFLNAPLEIELKGDGRPIRLLNWDKLADRLEPFVRAEPNRTFDTRTRQGLIMSLAADDLLTLEGMQIRRPLALGRTELPTAVTRSDGVTTKIRRSIDLLKVDPARCQATLSRATNLWSNVGFRQVSAVTATVSTGDGWVLSLHESTNFQGLTHTRDIHRTSTATCPGR